MDFLRAIHIIKDSIKKLDLNLDGLTVLTESGSNNFLYTPIIALLSGAEKVFVWIKDSDYGKATEIKADLLNKCEFLGLSDKLEVAMNLVNISHLQTADIITNSFNLRPLNEEKLKHLKLGSVIPLMYEKWEYRESDIDIQYCSGKGIAVGGTWENYPGLEIFDFCEPLIMKLIFNAGYEIKSNNVAIFSSDNFGKLAKKGIEKLGGKVSYLGINPDEILKVCHLLDFILFCDYKNKSKIIGDKDALFDIKKILKINPRIGIVHLSGDIDNSEVERSGGFIFPNKRGNSMRMTETLNYVGAKPTLMLLTAGLKVGEELYKKKISKLTQIF